MEKQNIKIEVPANLSHSSLVRHIADEVFGTAKFSKSWCSRLKLVVDELFMNAVRYGSTEGKSVVHVSFEFDENEVRLTMEDDGTGSQAIPAEELKKKIEQNEADTDLTRTSGRGLAMITKLWTDGVMVEKSQYGGIAVSFVKKIETSSEPPPPPPTPGGLIDQTVLKQIAEAKEAAAAVGAHPAAPAAPAGAQQAATSAQPVAGPVYEIKLTGELDQSNIEAKLAPVVDQVETIPQGGILKLDFSEVDYINSTVIGHIASFHNVLQKKGGKLLLANVNEAIREVLDLVGLLNVLEIQ